MPMPKASMNEDYLATTLEDEIRMARKRGIVQPVPVVQGMHEAAYGHLGLGILGTYQ